MASSSSSSKQRAQGGGRKANSEPRIQVFKEFGGCNFELSPRDFTLGKELPQEQSDLQMNYVVIQNNAGIVSNKTIETRNNLEVLFKAPTGLKFTDACLLYNDLFFIGTDDTKIKRYKVGQSGDPVDIFIDDADPGVANHHWTSFANIDNQIIGCTEEGKIWTSSIVAPLFSTAKKIPNPSAPTMSMLTAMGSLEIVDVNSQDSDHPYRIAIAYTYVNKFGPTKCSDQLTFYANYPISEWHGGRYLNISGSVPSGYDVQAIELYYVTGNASELQFAGRVDVATGASTWSFDWFGYLDATSMWPIANLIAPTENYTQGVDASHVTCIDSRVYFWGCSDKPERLYIGGNSGNLLSVSPGTGGGFVDVEPGTGQDIRCVMKYKTQSGASIVTMLCNSENTMKEQRFNLVENSVALTSDSSMKSWQAEQVAGAIGCKSYNGAVVCEDGLYSVSRYGLALTTMTMEYNSQIRTNYVSDPIKPAFTDRNRDRLKNASIIECDGVIYMAFGKYHLDDELSIQSEDSDPSELDNILFCYDVDMKAWWTISLDIYEPILKLVHIDWEGYREGIGIITENAVYLLPLTIDDSPETDASFNTIIQTGELSITQPQQNWFYLSQLEFRFDYFRGAALVELFGIDQFGRDVTVKKLIDHTDFTVYDLAEYMRVDLRLQSYQIRITGKNVNGKYPRFRLTHFMAKVYTMSSKQGLVWGFDDSQSFRTFGDIHPTFKDYNDIRQAIIP